MTIYGLWHGGNSYGHAYHADLEVFSSWKDMLAEFRTRFESGRWNTFNYANGTANSDDTPAVDETSTMHVYLSDPSARDIGDWYPDRILTIGPRGGVRMERA